MSTKACLKCKYHYEDAANYPCNRCHENDEFVEQEKPIQNEVVNHPNHYTKGKIEVIDFIEDQKLDFCLGNVIKYVCRHENKGGVEDLKKAAFYLNRKINGGD